MDSHKIGIHEVTPVVPGWAQELPADIVHETPTTSVSNNHVTGWPQRDHGGDCVGLGGLKALSRVPEYSCDI